VFANFNSFPETLIQVSDIEILLSDAVDVAEKLEQNNNQVTLTVYKNLPHVWQVFGFLPEAKEATAEISNFLNN
jgi:acetyl esterase/lipase